MVACADELRVTATDIAAKTYWIAEGTYSLRSDAAPYPFNGKRRSTTRAMIEAPTGRIDGSSVYSGLCSGMVPA
jgi:hypothetical protein